MDEPLSNSPKKEQGGLLTIVWDPEVGEPCMFGNGMYLYVFYCLSMCVCVNRSLEAHIVTKL